MREFLLKYRWARTILIIIVSIITSLTTKAILFQLMAAGYIPTPRWL